MLPFQALLYALSVICHHVTLPEEVFSAYLQVSAELPTCMHPCPALDTI